MSVCGILSANFLELGIDAALSFLETFLNSGF